MRMVRHFIITLGVAAVFIPSVRAASVVPLSVHEAIAYVVCGARQGSGTLTETSHILTVGHVVIDPDTGIAADTCRVGFIVGGGDTPNSFYRAETVHAVFSDKYDLDFAILRITGHLQGPVASPQPLAVDLFVDVGDPVTVVGYPGSENGVAAVPGMVEGFSRGTIQTDAVISQGYSGGPSVDGDGDLIGMASRITYLIDPDTAEEYDHRYILGDMATMISWIDALGDEMHETYLSHADPDRFSALPYFIRDEDPGCIDVVRTTLSSTVYCLLTGNRRFVFPNASVYFSWYEDFSPVQYVSLEDIARFTLVGNMTYRAGSLVKITTDPKVYLVTDTFGTLRPVANEERARTLFGDNWAASVRDVPDAFFIDYTIGRTI